MDADAKIAVAKQKKDVADQAFKAGEVVNGTVRHTVSNLPPCVLIVSSHCPPALRSYHEVSICCTEIKSVDID